MDKLLGGIIDDYTLYTIIESIIIILILIAVYLGIQIVLIFKFPKKKDRDAISQRNSMIRSSIFILIGGIFMVVHELTEGLEKDALDYTTYEFFELIALLGLVLFLYEWGQILKGYK
ncbi:MAG: hypothetical protein J5U17_00235 [Candidatus Methanoperedens sp.]|nr:hypothetical protein [Candidatus Methanoperedens sp.]MCE8427048.1 hypothetical protein [Candidatus Methanoperedens sp.]